MDEFLGIEYERTDSSQMAAIVPLRKAFLTETGAFRSGVAAAIAEEIASIGTAFGVVPEGKVPMGTRNDTSVVGLPSGDRMRARAQVVSAVDDQWIWDGTLTTEDGELVAISRVAIAVRPVRPGQSMPDLDLSRFQSR